jgi:hypothetical protein
VTATVTDSRSIQGHGAAASSASAQNVFINCPFDETYRSLLRPLVFTVIYAGLNPRLALERMDSGEPRIRKIERLIRESRFAIHDLSRIQAERKGEYFRLNMPFELGLDVGCRMFGQGEDGQKRCLILEKERYRYQAALSDLSSSDIRAHGDDPEELVAAVRDWLVCEAAVHLPSPSRIWDAFNEFMADDYDRLTAQGFTAREIPRLPVVELIDAMKSWVAGNA